MVSRLFAFKKGGGNNFTRSGPVGSGWVEKGYKRRTPGGKVKALSAFEGPGRSLKVGDENGEEDEDDGYDDSHGREDDPEFDGFHKSVKSNKSRNKIAKINEKRLRADRTRPVPPPPPPPRRARPRSDSDSEQEDDRFNGYNSDNLDDDDDDDGCDRRMAPTSPDLQQKSAAPSPAKKSKLSCPPLAAPSKTISFTNTEGEQEQEEDGEIDQLEHDVRDTTPAKQPLFDSDDIGTDEEDLPAQPADSRSSTSAFRTRPRSSTTSRQQRRPNSSSSSFFAAVQNAEVEVAEREIELAEKKLKRAQAELAAQKRAAAAAAASTLDRGGCASDDGGRTSNRGSGGKVISRVGSAEDEERQLATEEEEGFDVDVFEAEMAGFQAIDKEAKTRKRVYRENKMPGYSNPRRN